MKIQTQYELNIIVKIIGQLTSSTTKVDLKLSLDAKNDQASIKITGPDGKWFGVGLGAKTFTMVGFFYETVFYDFSKFQHPASEAANKFEVFQIRQSIAHFDHWKPLISRIVWHQSCNLIRVISDSL